MGKTFDVSLEVNGRAIHLTSEVPESISSGQVLEPIVGGMVRVKSFGGLFSADLISAAAFHAAVERGETARTIVFVECDAVNAPVAVVTDPSDGKSTIVLPVPEIAHVEGDSLRVMFPGIACVVSPEDAAPPETDGPVLFVCRRHDYSIASIAFRRSIDAEWISLCADGLAAAAAAIEAASVYPDGVLEQGVGMPGGDVEVGVSMRGGVLSGLSVCSMVRYVN